MKLIVSIFTVYFVLIAQPGIAQSLYNVTDGNIADWGVTFTSEGWKKNYLQAHLPVGKNDVDYVTEDNADKNSRNELVGPGYTQGNTYDAEAMYFDNDRNYGYIAIVTGLSPTESTYPAGDILLDTGQFQLGGANERSLYQYVIDIGESKLYKLTGDANHRSAWKNVAFSEYAESNPWRATHNNNKRTFIADVLFHYSPAAIQTHYFLEARFPLAGLGLSANPGDPDQDLWLHWTMKCGNDVLNLKADIDPVSTPEPATFALLLSGLGFGWRSFRNKK